MAGLAHLAKTCWTRSSCTMSCTIPGCGWAVIAPLLRYSLEWAIKASTFCRYLHWRMAPATGRTAAARAAEGPRGSKLLIFVTFHAAHAGIRHDLQSEESQTFARHCRIRIWHLKCMNIDSTWWNVTYQRRTWSDCHGWSLSSTYGGEITSGDSFYRISKVLPWETRLLSAGVLDLYDAERLQSGLFFGKTAYLCWIFLFLSFSWKFYPFGNEHLKK